MPTLKPDPRFHKARQCHAALTPHTHLDRQSNCVDDAGKGALGGDLTARRDTFTRANGRLTELKTQQTDLEAKLGNDYGLEEALGALVDKCFEAQVWVSCVVSAAACDSALTRGQAALIMIFAMIVMTVVNYRYASRS